MVCRSLIFALLAFTWQRSVTDNFVILSEQKSNLSEAELFAEAEKERIFSNWGFTDIQVPIRKRYYNLENEPGIVLIQDDEFEEHSLDGAAWNKTKRENVVWFSDQKNLSLYLTLALVHELDQQRNVKTANWALVGMAVINSRSGTVFVDRSAMGVDELFSIELEGDIAPEHQLNAARMCLFLYKEMGKRKFHRFISGPPTEKRLKDIYGFRDFTHLEDKYFLYAKYLAEDLRANRTPSEYIMR